MLRYMLRGLLVLSLLCVLIPSDASTAQSTATIVGTIRYNSAPVEGVFGFVFWEEGGAEFVTGPDGMYLVGNVPTGKHVMVFVRPPVELRLAYRNRGIENLTGDLVLDFDMQPGYLFSAQVLMPDGTPPQEPFWMGMMGNAAPPEHEWLGETVQPPNGLLEVVLPPDVYRLEMPDHWLGLILPDIVVDLTSGDVQGMVITIEEYTVIESATAIPSAPPRADLIRVSAPDPDGYATVTGAAGSVPPRAMVFIGNVSTHVFATVESDIDGAFSARLYAPPGSYVLVKYGVGEQREWIRVMTGEASGGVPGGDQINELPGAMLQVGGAPLNGHQFNSAGAFVAGVAEIHHWTGWWFSGSLQGAANQGGFGFGVQRGQQITITGTLRVTSPGIDCTDTPPNVNLMAHVDLRYLFGADGYAEPWGVWFISTLFTPTGLPIEHEAGGEGVGVGSTPFFATTCAGPHSFDAPLNITFTVPNDLPDGVYMPSIFIPPPAEEVLISKNEQQIIIWYEGEPRIEMPPLVLGATAPPRIPWVLLGDVLVNGSRGITAREDAGEFAMPTRVVIPPEQAVIPRLDARSGQPIAYQLEPGSPWLSQTDRRQPNPPFVPLALPSGNLTIQVQKPDGGVDILGPAPIRQSSVRTPSTPGGTELHAGTGQIADLFHLATMDEAFAYQFDQYGHHVITLNGTVNDIFGNAYPITGTYDIYVAQTLDLDPAQLPTTPYMQGDAFAPGLHVFPPVPADVVITVTHLPYSDPNQAVVKTFIGRANRFGYFQPPIGEDFTFETPGEFRVDYTASYQYPDGTLWMGTMTWGNVVEGTAARIEAHGRRGMDYPDNRIDDMPAWFEVFNLPPNKVGIENYYPYFSGDIHWGNEDRQPGDSIHSIITIKDITPDQIIYNLMRQNISRARNEPRWPPAPFENRANALEQRIAIGEAPLFITTNTGLDPAVYPAQIDLWGYWYGSSQRPDVRVREIIAEDGMGTAYWRFGDTYGYQIGESAEGDLPGDLKWEFGGAVFRVPALGINEYAIYSSLWVLLPHNDPIGARVTPPFQDATGASINGGPIMMLQGEDIDMLFLPKSIRPGDLLQMGDVVAFSGHVGPPLDSRVTVTITAPSGAAYSREWHANKIGWLYDPAFNFVANEAGRWTVDMQVVHDRPYVGNGVIPQSHNTGTVLGTSGQYEFYVVLPDAPRLEIVSPQPGFITWPEGRIVPLMFEGFAPIGATAVYYTVHDKGVVMDQGMVVPAADGSFTITYDARTLHDVFPFLSLTAREGMWEGLADEVTINVLAVGGEMITGNTITLIGEEIFIGAPDVW
ncbi:MAG: carboxypeptidase-like regulatory domain-containing protein [Anaerolineae bacterium]|nr:carboxypeptidase-like regulatory domain-containing protein [Anaerolineae bacterium]